MNVYETAVLSPPHASDHPDAVRGPWLAVLTDQHGWPANVDDYNRDGEAFEVAVVRGSAAPKLHGHRRPASYQAADVLYEIDDFADRDDLAARWAQARLVAALLNANQDKLDALAAKAGQR